MRWIANVALLIAALRMIPCASAGDRTAQGRLRREPFDAWREAISRVTADPGDAAAVADCENAIREHWRHRRRFQKDVSVHGENIRLSEAVAQIARQVDFPLRLNSEDLVAAGIPGDPLVSINVDGIWASSALSALLWPLNADWWCSESEVEVHALSPWPKIVKAYRVDDLPPETYVSRWSPEAVGFAPPAVDEALCNELLVLSNSELALNAECTPDPKTRSVTICAPLDLHLRWEEACESLRSAERTLVTVWAIFTPDSPTEDRVAGLVERSTSRSQLLENIRALAGVKVLAVPEIAFSDQRDVDLNVPEGISFSLHSKGPAIEVITPSRRREKVAFYTGPPPMTRNELKPDQLLLIRDVGLPKKGEPGDRWMLLLSRGDD